VVLPVKDENLTQRRKVAKVFFCDFAPLREVKTYVNLATPTMPIKEKGSSLLNV
jgi:hypothetical protein